MRTSSSLSRFVLILVLALVTVSATVVLDRLVGLFKPNPGTITGLIFPPHARASYEGIEFRFTVSTNALGFRDYEFALPKSASCRIIAIGDSFTYGWGVSLDQSWPKILERNLRRAGLNVEIANLGFPGGGPSDYANIAEKAIPLLKPDLVVIATLQGDDLAQSLPSVRSDSATIRTRISTLLRVLYPNFTTVTRTVRYGERSITPKAMTREWTREARAILAGLNTDEARRYKNLDRLIQHAFESGHLNPALIYSALKHPDYFLQTFDLLKPDTQRLIGQMAAEFLRIKAIADHHRARVVILSVPFGIYVSPYAFATWQQYGFELDDRMLVSDSPDRAIKLASSAAGLHFFTVTQHFRAHQDAHFFYEFDGHFDASGHEFYADHVTPILTREIADLPQRCLR